MQQAMVAYVAGAILLIIALFLLARPIKALFKVIINSALGCVGIALFNLVGGLLGLSVGLNIITALTVGILGMPGFALILFLQKIL